MKLQRMPIIVTTKEALDASVTDRTGVIYVGNELYLPEKESIDYKMALQGYQKAKKQVNKGIFFVRSGGEKGFDEDLHEIYDPFGIL